MLNNQSRRGGNRVWLQRSTWPSSSRRMSPQEVGGPAQLPRSTGAHDPMPWGPARPEPEESFRGSLQPRGSAAGRLRTSLGTAARGLLLRPHTLPGEGHLDTPTPRASRVRTTPPSHPGREAPGSRGGAPAASSRPQVPALLIRGPNTRNEALRGSAWPRQLNQ